MDALDHPPTHPGPAWHADPLGSSDRLRWWDGLGWTAWVAGSAIDTAAISWRPELAELPPPIHWGTPALHVAVAPPLAIGPLEELPTPAVGMEPPLAAPPMEPAAMAGVPPSPVDTAAPARRKRRRHLVLVAAVLPLLVAGVASAALLTPNPPRPVLTTAVAYRDSAGGFSLSYPPTWRIQRSNPGQGIQFLVGPSRVPPERLTTVSVVVGTQRGPLPAVADLDRTATDGLRSQLPGIRLIGNSTTTLAGRSALQLQLTDPVTSPPVTVEQVTGRTADDRPLTVTITVRDPLAAPSGSDLHDFLASVAS